MAEAERTCPNCGRPVTATARICSDCGEPLPLAAPVPGPITDPAPPQGAQSLVLAAASVSPPAAPEPSRGRRRRESAADAGLAAPPPPGSPAALSPASGPPPPPVGTGAPSPHSGVTGPVSPMTAEPVPWIAPPGGELAPGLPPPSGAASPPPPGIAPSPPPGGMPPPGMMPPPGVMPPYPGSMPPPVGADLPPGEPYQPEAPPYPPGYPYAPAGPMPLAQPPPPPFPRPDVNIVRAVRRSTARSTVTAGIAAGLVSAALVTVASALVATLWWAAHLANNCSAQASLNAGDCTASGANGYLANLNAVLWQAHGSGEVIGLASGADATVRIPLGLGILLVGGALYLAGRLTVRMLFLRSPRDAALRSVVIAATHTAAMMVIGAALTARGNGLALGPHYGLLLLWGLGLGFVVAYAGILRRTFPHVPRKALVDRGSDALGPVAPVLRAALTGFALALSLSAVAGILAMATHMGQTADALRAVVSATTTKPWPDGGLGTFAAIVLLVLSAPTWAAWVLAYSLVIPTVSNGPYGDFGLTVGDHDAYFWVVVLVPIVSTLFTGFAAARLRRAGSVEAAVVAGAGAGLLWAMVTWIVVAILDGVASVGGRAGGGILPADLAFGPALGSTLGALLAWGLVGGVIGAYVSLVTVTHTSRLPFMRRYSAAVVGAPIVIAVHVCPACSRQVAVEAAFCSRCGTPLSSQAADAAAQRTAMLSDGPPPVPPGRPPAPPPEPWPPSVPPGPPPLPEDGPPPA